MVKDQNQEMESELAFLAAMQAYRSARDSGDIEAIAKAEEAWRTLVRDELHAQNEGD